MKKLIAILAVFAVVAGAAFAQEGSWSVGGSGKIGTTIEFQNIYDLDPPDNHASIYAQTYEDWNGGSDIKGSLGITYNRGGLSTGLDFSQTGTSGKLYYNGDNLAFGAKSDIRGVINMFQGIWSDDYDYLADPDGKLGTGETAVDHGTYWEVTGGADGPYTISKIGGYSFGGDRDRLWGNYTFDVLNGLKLELAYAAEDGSQWQTTDIFGDTLTHHAVFGRNYLLIDVNAMDGLSLGIKVRNVFAFGQRDFLNDVLRTSALGFKFETGPLAAALQLKLEGDKNADEVYPNRLYLGVSYGINDQMSAGLEFRGEFGQYAAGLGGYSTIQFGGKFNFNDGPLGIGVAVKFEDPNTALKDDFKDEKVNISPTIEYKVVPEYLLFILEADFEIPFGKDANDKALPISYTFKPQISFNFLGNGTQGYWGLGTGIYFRYTISGDSAEGSRPDTNKLDITFKWSF